LCSELFIASVIEIEATICHNQYFYLDWLIKSAILNNQHKNHSLNIDFLCLLFDQ
jgi:hypothetical protein